MYKKCVVAKNWLWLYSFHYLFTLFKGQNLTASNENKSMMQTIKYSRSFKTTQQLIPNHSCIYSNDIRKKRNLNKTMLTCPNFLFIQLLRVYLFYIYVRENNGNAYGNVLYIFAIHSVHTMFKLLLSLNVKRNNEMWSLILRLSVKIVITQWFTDKT